MASPHPSSRLPPDSLAWLTSSLLVSLYFVGYFQRVAPAVMVDELMRDFSITVTMLGNLSALYFHTYAAMQIPSGVLAGVPLSEAVASVGWRAAMLASAVVTLVLAAVVWLWVRDDPSERGYASHAHPQARNSAMSPRRSLKRVISERDTWLLFFAGGLIAAPVLTFAGPWGVPYLVQVHDLGRSHAAGFTTTMLLGFDAIQQSAMGWILDRNWQGATIEGARIYDAAAYHAAFLWLAVSAVGAVLFVALTRETWCRLRFDAST